MVRATNNRVLRSLSAHTRQAVLDVCTRVDLEDGAILARAGELARTVHFPETSVISVLATYRDGSMIEMANIGRETCSGIGLALERPYQLNTNEVQIRGSALEMSAEDFMKLRSLTEFRSVLLSTVQALFYQVMVSGGCNGAHDARQRLARWLLTMSDRNDHQTMRLTQDFLAKILGVRRATITGVASELQRAGLIEYARGHITIIDHPGLRNVSCECYDLVREAYGSLLPDKNEG